MVLIMAMITMMMIMIVMVMYIVEWCNDDDDDDDDDNNGGGSGDKVGLDVLDMVIMTVGAINFGDVMMRMTIVLIILNSKYDDKIWVTENGDNTDDINGNNSEM